MQSGAFVGELEAGSLVGETVGKVVGGAFVGELEARSLVGETVGKVVGAEVVGLVGVGGVGLLGVGGAGPEIPIFAAALATSPFIVMIPIIDQHLE